MAGRPLGGPADYDPNLRDRLRFGPVDLRLLISSDRVRVAPGVNGKPAVFAVKLPLGRVHGERAIDADHPGERMFAELRPFCRVGGQVVGIVRRDHAVQSSGGLCGRRRSRSESRRRGRRARP